MLTDLLSKLGWNLFRKQRRPEKYEVWVPPERTMERATMALYSISDNLEKLVRAQRELNERVAALEEEGLLVRRKFVPSPILMDGQLVDPFE